MSNWPNAGNEQLSEWERAVRHRREQKEGAQREYLSSTLPSDSYDGLGDMDTSLSLARTEASEGRGTAAWRAWVIALDEAYIAWRARYEAVTQRLWSYSEALPPGIAEEVRWVTVEYRALLERSQHGPAQEGKQPE
jgi:hypothetical protein